jgi:SAM-dependent methyltransferase
MTPSLQEAVSAGAFEARYRADPDPWDYAASVYERHKYQTTISALTRPVYESGFEPACSVGELTALLAPRCKQLLSTDVSATAVKRARQRCARFPCVRIECRDLLEMRTETGFDLIVLSEVGYYFETATLAQIARRLADSLLPQGELIAVHWLGHSTDHVLHGDEVHYELLQSLPLTHLRAERHPGFRLDSWKRP